MGRTKVTVNEMCLIERGKRHQCILSGMVEMCKVGFKFSHEETSKGRRSFDIILAFVKGNVLGGLDLSCLKIFVMCMLHGLLASQEESWPSMCINFSISRFSRKGTDLTAEHEKKRERDWAGNQCTIPVLMQCNYFVGGSLR